MNNAAIVLYLGSHLEESLTSRPPPRSRISSDPCLPRASRLPSAGSIQRDAEREAPLAHIKQLRRSPSPPLHEDSEESSRHERKPSVSSDSTSPPTSPLKRAFSWKKRDTKLKGPWKDPEPYEIYRAIERKDLMFLMEVRDRAFHLLLRKNGDATPLVHAMRIGRSHQEVAIVLLGAFSRWINNLSDEDFSQPKTMTLLKALRANLRIAIDHGLQTSHTDLVASFLQTLVMSEGDRWVHSQVSLVSMALRAGSSSKPVATAESSVWSFATKELGRAESIAALEDYVANATVDLLMMAAWSCVLESIDGKSIPVFYFARDDRVYKAFCERLYEHKDAVQRSSTRRLRWQLRVLTAVLETRATSLRRKVEVLREEFDEGPGV